MRRRFSIALLVLLWAFWLAGFSAARAQQQPSDAPGDLANGVAQAWYGDGRLRHERAVQTVALSPDGRFIASSARDFTIRVWDRRTGALVHSLIKPTNRLAYDAPEASTPCLLYSRDGKFLVAGRGNTEILIWDANSYRLLHRLTGMTGAIQALAIAPDGKSFASADSQQAIRLWDLASGKELKQLTLADRATAIVYTNSGDRLIAGCADGTIRIWQLDPLTLTRTIDAHERAVQLIALTPDGGTLASVGPEKEIRFWDIRPEANPQVTPLGWSILAGVPNSGMGSIFEGLHFLVLSGRNDHFSGAASPRQVLHYLPDGSLMEGGSGGVNIWGRLDRKKRGTISAGPVTCLASDSAGAVAVTGDENGIVRVWDLASFKEVVLAAGPIHHPSGMAFAGARLAVAYGDGQVLIWNQANVPMGKSAFGERLSVGPGAVAADGSFAAIPETADIATVALTAGGASNAIKRRPGTITQLALNGPSRLLAAAYADKSVEVCSTRDARLLWRSEDFQAPVRSLVFSSSGKILAGCSADDTLTLWDSSTGKEIRSFVESGCNVDCAAISPDGSLVAVGHPNGAVRIWQTETGKLFQLFEGQPGPVRSLVFSTDNRTLAVGSWLTVRLWELATGKERLRLYDLPGEVTAIKFGAGDESVLAGMSNTQCLRLSVLPRNLEVKAWSGKELDDLWHDLESADAARAYRALAMLLARPEVAVPLIRRHLQVVPPLTEPQRRIQASALEKLGSDQFDERQKAVRSLEQLGDAAEPGLRELLKRSPTSEVRFRIEEILQKLETPERERRRLSGLRGCELLERLGTQEAKSVLANLANGAPGVWLTTAARGSLDRLRK